MHRLGNLTMLPPGTNSKLKDTDPQNKVSAYETSGLMGTADVGRTLKQATWSARSVQDREEALLKWAQSAWKD
jgi:hypothetical protein